MSAIEQVEDAVERKQFAHRAARAARLGVMAWRTDAADGPVRYFVCWRGLVKLLPDLTELDLWLDRFEFPGKGGQQ